jgi:hypothetical protein
VHLVVILRPPPGPTAFEPLTRVEPYVHARAREDLLPRGTAAANAVNRALLLTEQREAAMRAFAVRDC